MLYMCVNTCVLALAAQVPKLFIHFVENNSKDFSVGCDDPLPKC